MFTSDFAITELILAAIASFQKLTLSAYIVKSIIGVFGRTRLIPIAARKPSITGDSFALLSPPQLLQSFLVNRNRSRSLKAVRSADNPP